MHSDAQIKNLNLELRRLQTELKCSKKKCAYDFVRAEREKVTELLRREKISLFDHKEDVADELTDESIDLILTNGKVDLDKVICLHILSIQQPRRCTREKFKGKNAVINSLTRYSNHLPGYLIEDNNSVIKCCCWDRDDLFSNNKRAIQLHLQINTHIELILQTVVNVLRNINPSKLKELSVIAHNVETIYYTLEKPENQAFLSSLLHSNFLKRSRNMRTEMCSLLPGKTEMVQDVSKFKKNMIFRLDVPGVLRSLYDQIYNSHKETKISTVIDPAEPSLEQLLQMKRRVSSNTSIVPGYQLLQKGSSTGGVALIDQNCTNVSYLAGENPTKEDATDTTIFMQAPRMSDHQFVVDKMNRIGDQLILAQPANKGQEVCLKIARRHLKAKKISTDDLLHEDIKEEVLKKLSNEERIAIAKKAAIMKNTSNVEGVDKSVPIAELLKGTVDKQSLLKLVREASEIEREVMFKPLSQGGMGLGELLMDNNQLKTISSYKEPGAENIAVVEKQPGTRAPKKLNVAINSPFGIFKMEQEVSKKEIGKSCGLFLKRLTANPKITQ